MLLRTSLAFFLLLSTIVTNAQELKWIPFEWAADSISGKYFDKLSILIPVKIDDVPANFTMQFDLGAVTTVIYGNAIQPYLDAYPNLKNKIDTSKKFIIQGASNPMFTNMTLKMGAATYKDINVGYFENFGTSIDKDSLLTKTEKHIGTIAPDLFQNKVLIIDYPRNRIGVAQEVPAQYRSATFQPFKSDDGRIKIPLVIADSTQYLLFDTGSSIFTVTTPKKNALETTDSEVVDSLAVMSWGNKITFYGVKTNKPIKYGSKVLDGSLIYYDEKETFGEFYKYMHIWGLTGNAYFLKNTVIIDYKHKLFGIL